MRFLVLPVVLSMVGALVAGATTSCSQQGLDSAEDLASLDLAYFRCNVQPVLAARCSFMACHGNDERPLMIFAEQRFRLDVSWDDYETPLTDDELRANFRMASAFVGHEESEANLLVEKPLDTRAGGLFHRGRDLFGQDDVFLDRQDVGYQVLREFGDGTSAPADCNERDEVGL